MRLNRAAALLALLTGCYPEVDLTPPGGGGLVDDTAGGDDGGEGTGDDGEVLVGELLVSPAEIDWGLVFTGSVQSEEITVENVGEGLTEVELRMGLGGEVHFSIEPSTAELAPGELSSHTLTFAPGSYDPALSTEVVVEDLVSEQEALISVIAVIQVDNDGDGVGSEATGGEDCDDNDASAYPGAEEVWYDGTDQDCAGDDDYDQDGDSYAAPEGGGEDCDDTDAEVYPGAEDTWYDGVDSDCDGAGDYDADGDGHVVEAYGGGDCDDTDATVSPDAEEIWYDGVDQDCDDASDYDADEDTYDAEAYGGEDCDDLDAAVNPGATEVWYDGVDTDCQGDDDYDADGDGGQSDAYGGSDCDDDDANVYSGATEVWYDGVDQDCDGGSDYDADGDGFEFEDYGGADCDDTDSSINPRATEVWYDGVDQDCDDASDYDADGDGYDSDDHGGDDCDDTQAKVNTGMEESWYDGVDQDCDGGSDYDADGDGYDSEDYGGTDCDDNDARVGEPTDETLNSADDDCDGTVDNLAISDAASGVLYGYDTEHELGHRGSLGAVGDVDDDGSVDVVITTRAIDEGYAWVVDGATAMTASGGIDSSYSAILEGDHSARALGYVLSPSADEDGDGVVELLVGGSTTSWYYSGYGRSYLYTGGSSISGTLDISDYDAYFNGDSSSDNMRLAGLADVDGDGLADVVAASRYDSSWDSSDWRPYHGNVAVFQGGSLTSASDPRYDPALADHDFQGTSGYDYLGTSLMLADLDNDGYSDIIAGAPGDDDAASNAGAVYIFTGNSSLSWNTDADDAAAVKITGDTSDDELGSDTIPSAGDVDGDGLLDLLIAAEDVGEAWLFLTAGSLNASTSTSNADHAWSGSSGDFASAACIDSDLDGDGADEVALGGDSADVSTSNSGVVYLYFYDSSWSSSLTSSDADATIWGDDSDDYLGTGMAGGQDLDGDGLEDLLVGAVGVDDGASDGGAVYFIGGW